MPSLGSASTGAQGPRIYSLAIIVNLAASARRTQLGSPDGDDGTADQLTSNVSEVLAHIDGSGACHDRDSSFLIEC